MKIPRPWTWMAPVGRAQESARLGRLMSDHRANESKEGEPIPDPAWEARTSAEP